MGDLEKNAIEYWPERVEEIMSCEEELDFLSRSDADFIYWSKMPFWSLDESIALLLGKDPEEVNWAIIRHYVNNDVSSDLCWHYAKLRNLILRALENKEIKKRNTPAVFIAWADSKLLEIPEVLKQQVLVINKPIQTETEQSLLDATAEIERLKEELNFFKQRIIELEDLMWEGFDEGKSTHSKELAIAVKAHNAISKNHKTSISIKQQITLWLQENHPKLTNEEKKRISKMCNWQKSGGSPSTPS